MLFYRFCTQTTSAHNERRGKEDGSKSDRQCLRGRGLSGGPGVLLHPKGNHEEQKDHNSAGRKTQSGLRDHG